MPVGTGSIKRAATKAKKPAEADTAVEMQEEAKTVQKPAKRAVKTTQKATSAKTYGILEELPIYLL